MPDLLELADHVEALEGPSREVFIEAWNAILGWEVTSIKPGSKWQRFLVLLNLDFDEAYLGAAMLLVPEGRAWTVSNQIKGCGDGWLATAGICKARASTPAQALCAASLRAIAQEKGE